MRKCDFLHNMIKPQNKSKIKKDAEIYMNEKRRMVIDSTSNYSILGWCTTNNSTCNRHLSDEVPVCEFYEFYGNSCVSSYMAFGFGVIVFLIIPFLCLGCYTMADVTTPLRVPTRILPVRKEY